MLIPSYTTHCFLRPERQGYKKASAKHPPNIKDQFWDFKTDSNSNKISEKLKAQTPQTWYRFK